MLEATPALVNAVGPHPFWGGRPQALHVAIERNRHEMVICCSRAGADVNGKNEGYDVVAADDRDQPPAAEPQRVRSTPGRRGACSRR